MKQPSWKTPLILSSSLLILGSFSYWLTYSHKPKKEKSDSLSKKPLIIPTEDTQINHFRLKGNYGVFEVNCESLAKKTCKIGALGDWALTYPISGKADSESVKEVLTNLSNMLATETVSLEEETPEKQKQLIDEYGLSEAKRSAITTNFIEVTLENGKKLAAWFGEAHPVGDKTFVGSMTDGVLNQKTIYLIANFYKTNLEKSLTYFRDKSIFHFDRAAVESFEEKSNSLRVEGSKDGQKWLVNGKPGDHDRIETVLASIAQAKAKEFTSLDATKSAKSVLKYKLKLKDQVIDLDLVEKADKEKSQLFLRTSLQKEVYELDPSFRKQIEKRSGELRYSTLILPSEKTSGTRFKLEGPQYPSPSEFQFDGKAWKQTDAGKKIDASQIASFLDLLMNSHAKEVVAAPSGKPLDRLTLSFGDEKSPGKYRFLFFTLKNELYAQDLNQKTNEVFALDGALKSTLPFQPDLWKLK